MKQWLLRLGLIFVVCQNCSADVEWFTDLNAAMAKARAENKTVLMDFCGSDWCGWCMRLKSEVFDQPEFAAFAKLNLVMVEVDFPRNKELSPDQQEANNALARNYHITGYPTIVLVNELAQEIGRTGYLPGGPPVFIAGLEKVPGLKRVETPSSANRPPVAFVPIAPSVPLKYGDLALKAISGPKDRRMVLINNETFMVGDTAKVKTHDSRVEVTCKEIRDYSVLITVDGKPRELKLGDHP
jgi:thioredoxin-related protein